MSENIRASLAPIAVALLSIASVSLFGFAVAYWPPEEPPRAQVESTVSVTPQSYDGEGSFVAPVREQGRTRWM